MCREERVARQPLAVRCGSSARGEQHVPQSKSGSSAARSEVWLVSRWIAACDAEYEWPVSRLQRGVARQPVESGM